MVSELQRELETLAKAERDIVEGTDRLIRQEDMIARLAKAGHDRAQAERLADALRATLGEWRRHRRLIEQRIRYLEAREER